MLPVNRVGQTPILTLPARGVQGVSWVADGGNSAGTQPLAPSAGRAMTWADISYERMRRDGLVPNSLPVGVTIHSLGKVEARGVNKGREVPVAPGRYLLLDEKALDRTLALFVDRQSLPPVDFTSQVGLLYLTGPWDADTWNLGVQAVEVGKEATTVSLRIAAELNPPAALEYKEPVYQWAFLTVPKRPFGEIDYTLQYTGWKPRWFSSVEHLRELVLKPFFRRTMNAERVELLVKGRKGPLTVRLPDVDVARKDFRNHEYVNLWARANALPQVLDGRAVVITDKKGLSLREPFGR